MMDDLDGWPIEYRCGLVEGFVLGNQGYLILSADWVPTLLQLLQPVPPKRAGEFVEDLTAKVQGAAVPPLQTRDTEDWRKIYIPFTALIEQPDSDKSLAPIWKPLIEEVRRRIATSLLWAAQG